jgi:subtilisin
MRRQRLGALALILALSVAGLRGAQPAQAARHAGAPSERTVSGQYIVTFRSGVATQAKANQLSRRDGVGVRHVYGAALNGVSVKLSATALNQLRADPDVLSVTEDYVVHATADTLPSGVKRTQAFRNATANMGSQTNPVNVDVAVIDTGIDIDHPDLNVAGGISCVPGEPSYDDQNGHGTHVAGTIGALDNGSGVIGIAPGVHLYAVRVLNANGEGDFSDVICGINWVTQNANHIKVANLSLGGAAPEGSCTDQSLHQAICEAVDAGVTFTVAAGNDGVDAATSAPASYDEVITVSAIADTDGLPGAKGWTSFLYGNDDTLATFSNYGPDVDIAAPGVNIVSTWMGGGLMTISGTSMASPHVAGAAALYVYQHPGASPATVKAGLLAVAWAQSSADGFTNDPDGYPEPLLNVAAIGGAPLTPDCTLGANSGVAGQIVPINCAHFLPNEFVKVLWDSPTGPQKAFFMASAPGGYGSGTITVPDVASGTHTLYVLGSQSGQQTTLSLNIDASAKPTTPSGKVGSSFAVVVKGFAAGETVALSWFEGTNSTVIKTAAMATTGGAYMFAVVPEATAGPHVLQATGMSSGVSVTSSFTVLPGVVLSATLGAVGAPLTVTLKGYSPGETVSVNWHDSATDTANVGTTTVNTLGSGTVTFAVPDAFKGAHTVEGIGTSGNLGSAPFTVMTSMTMTPTNGQVDTPLTLALTGFSAGETLDIRWYESTTGASSVIMSVTASATGSATVSLTVPQTPNGTHKVEVIGSASAASVYRFFNVTPSLRLSPPAGPVGASVTATLAGYKPGQTVSVKWYTNSYTSTAVASVVVDALGSATVSFAVPTGASKGVHRVDAVSTTYLLASMNFTVN